MLRFAEELLVLILDAILDPTYFVRPTFIGEQLNGRRYPRDAT